MTTPRDDIAGLIDKLTPPTGAYGLLMVSSHTLSEAATQLDSLLKERDALQARVKELESGIAHAQYRSDNCDAENQSLYNRLEAVESRATRIQQERDEAYERAARISENPGFIEAQDTEWDLGVNFAKKFIADAIRRLAAGPEKEKKE